MSNVPKKLKNGQKKNLLRLKKRAKLEGAEIQWGDETGVRNNRQHGRSYAPKGKNPTKLSMLK
jgi:hypothetical protein